MTANRVFLLLALPSTFSAVYLDQSPGIHEPLRHGKLMRQEMRSETEAGLPGPRIEAAHDMHKSFEELDEQHSRQELSVEHFQLFDANADGLVDLHEALQHGKKDSWQNTLDKFDANGDATLSKTEFGHLCLERAGGHQNQSTALAKRRENLVARESASLHQAVSAQEELEEATRERIQTVSALRADVHESTEALAARLAHLAARFRVTDVDGDGTVTEEEYLSEVGASRFSAAQGQYRSLADTDRDGKVSVSEAAAASRFEFQHLGGGLLDVTLPALRSSFQDKGWLQGAAFEPARAMARGDDLQAIVSALMELEYLGPAKDVEASPTAASPSLLGAAQALVEEHGDAHVQGECLPSATTRVDVGYDDNFRGWYDVQGCGKCQDYCRWVGNSGSGGDPMTKMTHQQSWWSCRLAGTSNTYTKSGYFSGWSFGKCSAEGAVRALNIVGENEAMTVMYKLVMTQMSRILSVKFCWRGTYDRGVGQPASCKSGWEQKGQMCYQTCPAGWIREASDIEFCSKACPSGSTDTGLFCRTNGLTKSKTCCGRCFPKDWCCKTWCCGKCGAGWTSTGCFCEPSSIPQERSYSPGKTKFDTAVTGCTNPSYMDGPVDTPLGRFCYPTPKAGFTCWLTTCQEACDFGMIACGPGACAADKGQCGTSIGEMASSTLMAIGQTLFIVLTWGTGAVATVATRPVLDVAAQQGLKAAAKAALQKIQLKLIDSTLREVIKASVKKAVAKAIISNSIKFSVKGVTELNIQDKAAGDAFDAIVEVILKKREEDMGKFDFRDLDLTGIASAVKESQGGAHPVVQAQSWTRVASLVDPSGWVAAGATFANTMCNQVIER